MQTLCKLSLVIWRLALARKSKICGGKSWNDIDVIFIWVTKFMQATHEISQPTKLIKLA